jgi:hypothetical protein
MKDVLTVVDMEGRMFYLEKTWKEGCPTWSRHGRKDFLPGVDMEERVVSRNMEGEFSSRSKHENRVGLSPRGKQGLAWGANKECNSGENLGR